MRKQPSKAPLVSEEDPLFGGGGASIETVLPSEEDVLRELDNEWTQTALPTIPSPPGWHYAWLSTTNQYDGLARRIRMGYQPVKAAEVPGAEHLIATEGQFEGCISCNEMVLFKLPENIYQLIMTRNHYHAPRQEQEKLKATIKQQFKDSEYGDLARDMGDGFAADDEDTRPVRTVRGNLFTS